jgi:esterase/lipase superfamily enzyme
MQKDSFGWSSDRLPSGARVARWGHYGRPVLLFPTAGGDFEEVERHGLVAALSPLIDAGRIKVYSVDSVAGRHWIEPQHSPEYSSRVQNMFDAFIYHELVPLIRQDCASTDIEIVTAGASIGAFNAVALLCRHPDAFRLAIGMSGTYDLSRYVGSHWNDDFYYSSPLHYLPGLAESGQLDALRQRMVILASGSGRWENIGESWAMARVLGAKGVPNRVDDWGSAFEHDWPTWWRMLPQYLSELA